MGNNTAQFSRQHARCSCFATSCTFTLLEIAGRQTPSPSCGFQAICQDWRHAIDSNSFWEKYYSLVHAEHYRWFNTRYNSLASTSSPNSIQLHLMSLHNWQMLSLLQQGSFAKFQLRGLHDVTTLIAGANKTDSAPATGRERRTSCLHMLLVLVTEWIHTITTAVEVQSARTMV